MMTETQKMSLALGRRELEAARVLGLGLDRDQVGFLGQPVGHVQEKIAVSAFVVIAVRGEIGIAEHGEAVLPRRGLARLGRLGLGLERGQAASGIGPGLSFLSKAMSLTVILSCVTKSFFGPGIVARLAQNLGGQRRPPAWGRSTSTDRARGRTWRSGSSW